MGIGAEQYVLDSQIAELVGQGYEVLRDPKGMVLPPEIREYVPDILAVRGNEKLVVEVASRRQSLASRLSRLAESMSGLDGWKLKIVWVEDIPSANDISLQSEVDIEKAYASAAKLSENSEQQAALLLAWSTLEAVGRRLLPSSLKKPQTPGRIVEKLAQEGFLLPEQAAHLRLMAAARNRVVHGDLGLSISQSDVRALLGIIEILLGDVRQLADA